MKLSLNVRLYLTFILFSGFAFLLLGLFGGRIARQQELNSVVTDLHHDASYLAAVYQVNETVDQSKLETMATASDTDIWIIDLSGNIRSHSGDTVSGNDLSRTAVPDFNAADTAGGFYMTGTFFNCYDEDMLAVYAPLVNNISTQGYVILFYPEASVIADADSHLLIAYTVFAVMALLMFAITVLIDLFVLKPVRTIRKAGVEYVNGNLSYPLQVKQKSEIGDLADTVSELARQLNSSADDQHRFLANISHDFRSPLTSIRGYMVAIQDGTIPPEMQGKYIDVVIKEADRLTKLANGLIDMTKLENGIILEPTVFDINDLIRGILPTFEVDMQAKDLTFDITFDAEHTSVSADKDRIQQVLYNLIDNAIKFSGTSSTVDISTVLERGKVFVSVKDHGIGIEKESLNKIWDRFYKADASRGKDKKGTGLGLAIVREIIQAHKENIDVISTPGVGTEFIFTLPSAEKN